MKSSYFIHFTCREVVSSIWTLHFNSNLRSIVFNYIISEWSIRWEIKILCRRFYRLNFESDSLIYWSRSSFNYDSKVSILSNISIISRNCQRNFILRIYTSFISNLLTFSIFKPNVFNIVSWRISVPFKNYLFKSDIFISWESYSIEIRNSIINNSSVCSSSCCYFQITSFNNTCSISTSIISTSINYFINKWLCRWSLKHQHNISSNFQLRWIFDLCHDSSIFQSLKMICVEWSSSIVLISPQSSRKSCTKFTSSYLSIWSESVNSLTHQSHLARFSKVSSQVSFSCISVCERANFSSVYFSSKLFFSPVRDHFSQLTSSDFTVHISIVNRSHCSDSFWESIFICTSKFCPVVSCTIYSRRNESSKHQHSSWSCEHFFNVHSVCINKDKRFLDDKHPWM